MHLSDEQFQRFLHGELDEPQREVLSLHLAECGACARQLEEVEREEIAIVDLLRHLDHSAPVIEVETLIADRSGAYARWGRHAAGVLVAAALAGAAYAFPGSPLPALLHQAKEWISGQTPPPPPPAPPAAEPSTPARPETAGIAVPVGERFSIHFTAEQDTGDVTVSLTDGPNVVARVFSGTATFTTDVDRLTIQNQGSAANYEVELPRDAPRVEISVGTRRLILKEGDRITADVAADAQGRYVLSLSAAPSHHRP